MTDLMKKWGNEKKIDNYSIWNQLNLIGQQSIVVSITYLQFWANRSSVIKMPTWRAQRGTRLHGNAVIEFNLCRISCDYCYGQRLLRSTMLPSCVESWGRISILFHPVCSELRRVRDNRNIGSIFVWQPVPLTSKISAMKSFCDQKDTGAISGIKRSGPVGATTRCEDLSLLQTRHQIHIMLWVWTHYGNDHIKYWYSLLILL